MKSLIQEEHLASLIRGSLSLMCKTSLNYETELEIKGLLGITVDKKDVFLIDVSEFIIIEPTEDNSSTQSSTTLNVSRSRLPLKRKVNDGSPLDSHKRSKRTDGSGGRGLFAQKDVEVDSHKQTLSPAAGPISLVLRETSQPEEPPVGVKVEIDSEEEEIEDEGTEKDENSYGVNFESLTQKEIQTDESDKCSAVRFAPLLDTEATIQQDDGTSYLTKRHTNFAKRILCDYLREMGRNPDDFDDIIRQDDFDTVLEGFFLSLRTRKGGNYKSNSYIAIRFGLIRYCNSIGVDITDVRKFLKSNYIFKTVLKKLKEDDPVQHKISMSDFDKQQLNRYFESVVDSPVGLQQYVWYCTVLYLCRRGREHQRELNKSSFTIQTVNGVTFLSQCFDESMRNGQVSEKDLNKTRIIPEVKGSNLDPVECFRKYLSHLHPICDALFQKPKRHILTPLEEPWYCNSPVGKNTLCEMMKTISKMAGLTKIYTSHSVKAPVVTTLHDVYFPRDSTVLVARPEAQCGILNYWPDASIRHNPTHTIGSVASTGEVLFNSATASEDNDTYEGSEDSTVFCKLEPV